MINLIRTPSNTRKGSAVTVGVEIMTLAEPRPIQRVVPLDHTSRIGTASMESDKLLYFSPDSGAGIASDGADSLFGKFSQHLSYKQAG
jgi:hypothetical protein